MYAVIRTGGKQYKVAEGDVLQVEHLSVKGNKTTLVPILVVNDDGQTIIGAKDLKNYKVTVKLLGDAKGDKVDVFKYRPKSGYATRAGHRQLYSLIEITSIGQASEKKAKTEPEEAAAAEPAEAVASAGPVEPEAPSAEPAVAAAPAAPEAEESAVT